MRLRVAAAVLAFGALGCNCDDTSKRRMPRIELPMPDGTERRSLDFGTVQVDATHELGIRVRNGGAGRLNISKLGTAAPFGAVSALPVSLEPGGEAELLVSYSPTVPDKRDTGKLAIGSDDPERPEVSIDLYGLGIQAVAVATPNPIDFKDVYLKETGKVVLTLSNAGSNELDVLDAKFSPETPAPPVVAADLPSLKKKVPAGESASLEVSFSPAAMGSIFGALELTLDPKQGGKFSIPLRGRGVAAKPRMCFKFDGQGTESCTDPDSPNPNLQVRFPALCDNRLYPPDSGTSACTAATGEKKGQLYLRNEGNIPVSYTVEWVPFPYTKDRCDAGYAPKSDFAFSNAPASPDGGVVARYTQGTTKLPNAESDPKPWETTPVTLSYRAFSRCRDEATDLARVVWTRQGDVELTRVPKTILMTADGTSKLPRALNADWACGSLGSPQQVPCKFDFYGVSNAGDEALTVQQIQLWEELPNLLDGGMQGGPGPNGGLFQPCDFTNPYSDCVRFAWDGRDGGNPNQYAPHLIPASPNPPQQSQRVIGTLVFGPNGSGDCFFDAGACPNKLYRLYAVIQTDDPYSPSVLTRIQGVAAPPP